MTPLARVAGWVLALGADVVGFLAMHFDGGTSTYWDVSRLLTAVCLEIVGLLLWRRRPGNPVGPLLLGVGVIAMASHLIVVPHTAAFVIGFLISPFTSVMVAHAVLVYPDGRHHHRAERLFVLAAYGVTLVLQVSHLLVSRTFWVTGCERRTCIDNPVLVWPSSQLSNAINDATLVAHAALALAFVAELALRERQTPTAARRAYRPMIAAIAVLVVTYVARELVNWAVGPTSGLQDAVTYVELAASVALPVSMAYGLLRARPNVADLVTQLDQCPPEQVEAKLSAFLGDPTLKVALRRAGGEVVDLAGRPVDVDVAEARTAVDPDTWLLHSLTLLEDATLLRSVAAAARLMLDKARLQAEVRAQLRETVESRARLARAALDERRRIERDLHDGAQQRLIAVGMSIEEARSHLDDAPALTRALDDAANEVTNTLIELRELARGLRPALLVERGLVGAIPVLIRRTPLPVRCDLDVQARLPDDLEATAYFVVSEALQNVVKHARAQQARVAVALRASTLRIEVSDDGVGGAVGRNGSGLSGLADRVAAVAGELTVTSPPGRGTMVTARIPVQPQVA